MNKTTQYKKQIKCNRQKVGKKWKYQTVVIKI